MIEVHPQTKINGVKYSSYGHLEDVANIISTLVTEVNKLRLENESLALKLTDSRIGRRKVNKSFDALERKYQALREDTYSDRNSLNNLTAENSKLHRKIKRLKNKG